METSKLCKKPNHAHNHIVVFALGRVNKFSLIKESSSIKLLIWLNTSTLDTKSNSNHLNKFITTHRNRSFKVNSEQVRILLIQLVQVSILREDLNPFEEEQEDVASEVNHFLQVNLVHLVIQY